MIYELSVIYNLTSYEAGENKVKEAIKELGGSIIKIIESGETKMSDPFNGHDAGWMVTYIMELDKVYRVDLSGDLSYIFEVLRFLMIPQDKQEIREEASSNK